MDDLVIVNRNYSTNQLGRVYHKRSCHCVANMIGFTEMSYDKAVDLGKSACLWCHRAQTRNWLCPICETAEEPTLILMIPKAARGAAKAFLECPNCKLQLHQREG